MRDVEVTMRDLLEASMRTIDASMNGLREQLIAFQQASAREHAEVRANLGELRARLENVPTEEELARFKTLVYERLGRLEADLQQRTGGERARASLGRVVVAGCATAGTLCGLILSVSRLIFPGW